jgi:hypothetical protein
MHSIFWFDCQTIGKPNNSLEQPSSDTFSLTIGKPNNSLEQPSSDTFSQTIGKPNNYNVLLIKKPIKPKYRVHYKMIFQLQACRREKSFYNALYMLFNKTL